MAKTHLVLEGDDRGYFFLVVEAGNVTVGDHTAHPEAVIRGLRITRIRCEIEVEQELVVVTPASGETGELVGARRLAPGQGVNVGHARVRLMPIETAATASPGSVSTLDDIPGLLADDEPPRAAPAPAAVLAAAPPAPPPPGRNMVRRLRVIDGADKDSFFTLPGSGRTPIGKSHKHADIVLHDLYVSRVHCEVDVQEGRVLVTHVEGPNGTLINGKAITQQQELRPNDVLRVGNTQLRLEWAEAGEDTVELEERARQKAKEEAAAAAERARDPLDGLAELAGQVLGHYRLGPLLGRGHAGVVFRAQDQRNNQTVVVKVLSAEFPANAAELQRFVNAMKVVPQLDNEHLVPIQGAGKSGAHCWIAREYVDGESLAQLVDRLNESGKFNWVRAARVATHLGRALGFLRSQKVTHGNITPQNVLVRTADKLTMLTDLMLMRALEGSKLEQATRNKRQFAELPYTAPELIGPDGVAPDDLSDLYSLGAVVYLVLTGKPPFSARTEEQLVARIQGLKPDKPTKFQSNIPPEFEGVVLKLLAKKGEERFPSPAALLRELDAITEEHDVEV